MRNDDATMRARELGAGLRRAMAGAGLTGAELAHRLDWSPGLMSRILSGQRKIREIDVAAILTLCGVKGEPRQRLVDLCRDQGVPGWLQEFGDRLPQQLVTLVDQEDLAERITDFELAIVPGLLQTEAYARALITSAANIPADEIADRVNLRMTRQALLYRSDPPRFTVYLHEGALRVPVGGPAMMADQLRHLLAMIEHPAVTVRVVPNAAGAHAGVHGAFRLMEFREVEPVVYLEDATTALFPEQRPQITTYRKILDALAGLALDEAHSGELIASVARELSATLED